MDAQTLFNRKFFEMMEALASAYPTVTEFAFACSPATRLLVTMDPTQPRTIFDEYVAKKFETQIIARDDAFFLSHADYGPSLGSNQHAPDIVSLIKRVWQNASDADHDAIWQHLHVLLILNKRCTTRIPV